MWWWFFVGGVGECGGKCGDVCHGDGGGDHDVCRGDGARGECGGGVDLGDDVCRGNGGECGGGFVSVV